MGFRMGFGLSFGAGCAGKCVLRFIVDVDEKYFCRKLIINSSPTTWKKLKGFKFFYFKITEWKPAWKLVVIMLKYYLKLVLTYFITLN